MPMIGSHIIPKFYLEQFATPSVRGRSKPGRIWVYEKGKRADERGTSVQGVENGYFGFVGQDGELDESFETVLANLENECNEVLVCAKSDLFHWPHNSLEKLAFYAALLYSRATQRRTFTQSNWNNIVREMNEALSDTEFIKELASGLSRRIGHAVTEQQMRYGIQEWIQSAQNPESARESFLADLRENSEFIASLLLKKEPWRVFRPADGTEFVTSDNPLITFVPLKNGKLHPGYGFRKAEAMATFPLAPNACLAMGDAWQIHRTLDAATVRELNEAVINLSDAYVYSKTYASDVEQTMNLYGGSSRYGVNAFVPIGLNLPTARQFLLRHFGIDAE
jgi:hypothetical protein